MKLNIAKTLTLSFTLLLFAAPFLIRAAVKQKYESSIHDVLEAPERSAALVFGAAVRPGGYLSTVLRDRMDTAVALYHDDIVDTLVVSGHQNESGYDEPASMRAYAISQGVLASDITTDVYGDRTFDTCYRARDVFRLESILLVTQEFHLPRALLTCRGLGLDAAGVRADMRTYRGSSWYEFRETMATLAAIVDLARNDGPETGGAAAQSTVNKQSMVSG